jgi:hypothetical protein
VFVAETSGRVKCQASKQFPAPGTILQVPMPDPRAKKVQMPGGGPGGGWAMLELTDALASDSAKFV